MSPIEVSENPRRANSLRLASRIFVLARGSPRLGRVNFGPSQDDWSTSSHTRAYPKYVVRPVSMDLLGKFVPTLSVSNPRPELPATRLRDAVQPFAQAPQAVGNKRSRLETGELEGESFGALGHHAQSSPKAPVRSGKTGYISDVDAI